MNRINAKNVTNISLHLTLAQAATGIPQGRRSPRKVLNAREKQRLIANRETLTAELMEALPKLLSKFGTDREKVPLLLQIPRYFDLKIFTDNRSETNLEDLLIQLTEILEKHSLEHIMEEVAETLAFFVNTEESICTKVTLSFNYPLLARLMALKCGECAISLNDFVPVGIMLLDPLTNF